MKPRVVVSQRRDEVAGRDELRDALDTRLCAFLWNLGFSPIPMASAVGDYEEYVETLAPDAVVLSGGNDIGQAVDRDQLEAVLLSYAAAYHLPVLGICRGMQMMNHYQGGRLRTVSGHAATCHQITGPLVGLGSHEVNSYHNQGLLKADLGNALEATAWSSDGVVEALRHRELPWLGIMWHPERNLPLSDFDRTTIRTHFQGLLRAFPDGDLQ